MFVATVTVPMTALSDYIQRQMRRQRMDATELARAAQLSESTARPIIRGSTRTPDIMTLRALAGPLGVSFESLCRVAVGMDADAEEPRAPVDPLRQKIMDLLAEADPERLERVRRLLLEFL